jgi:hypothetical protein
MVISCEFSATLVVDDDEFARLGGTSLHVLHVGDVREVDLAAEGSPAALDYVMSALRSARPA